MFYRHRSPEHFKDRHPGGGPMITKQSHKDECDIHNIMKQYQRTGVITHIAKQGARFEDLPDFADYQEGLNTAIAAQEAFQALPSSVRDRYGNDPGRFLAAFVNPSERAYLEEMGLLKPRPKQDPAQGSSPPEPQAA